VHETVSTWGRPGRIGEKPLAKEPIEDLTEYGNIVFDWASFGENIKPRPRPSGETQVWQNSGRVSLSWSPLSPRTDSMIHFCSKIDCPAF